MYRTASGILINADANGAANILKKVTKQSFNMTKMVRGALTLPHRYDLFTNLSKSYRNKGVRRRYANGDSGTGSPYRVTSL
ncbi:hypothetical protein [Moorena producens]|uniref:hypothetical protein n=1 Tax=Moorena producens TaxID=1155739 RepID=UPI003C7358F0